MANLKKRELIILGVMGVAVLFGAYTLLTPARSRQQGGDTTLKTENLSELLKSIADSAATNTTTRRGDLIYARARKEWTRDPFWDSGSYKKWLQAKKLVSEKNNVVKKIDLIYTGYLEINGKKLAIINDIEYKEGEKLEIKDHVLRSVTPASVVIENTATGARQSVLLQDDYAVKVKIDASDKLKK
jgi:hypothetical protein